MSINASAVLVDLNISVWPATKVDREVTDNVNAQYSAGARDASQTKKNLFAGTSLRGDIEKLAARVRLFHNQHTLPWADKGERLLPTKLFMDYKAQMNTFEDMFTMKCNEFFDAYPALVQAAPLHLGRLYKADDYPPLEEVRQKFSFSRHVKPLPEKGDFRLDIPNEDLEALRSEYERNFNDKLAEAMRTPWERLHETLTGISEKMQDTADGKRRRYHDSLLTNPIELCEVLRKLNVTGDPKLDSATRALEATMLAANMDAIRESEEARNELKSKVDAIRNKFSDWGV